MKHEQQEQHPRQGPLAGRLQQAREIGYGRGQLLNFQDGLNGFAAVGDQRLGRGTLVGRIRQRVFGISLKETSFARRGFAPCDVSTRERLESIGQTFVAGYHYALLDPSTDFLSQRLDTVEVERRGFAYEGAAMGLALLDRVLPFGAPSWPRFLKGPGLAHAYMVHVGVGWALARLHRSVARALKAMDPLFGWLAVDGYGFHQGYFHWQRFVALREAPRGLTGYATRAFDQGLGRSLWFVGGGSPYRIAAMIAAFEVARRADLWSGVGLAAAYAGGVDRSALEALCRVGGPFRPEMAQGAAFAAEARQRAGNPAAHTDLACEVLCDLSSHDAAALTEASLHHLPFGDLAPAYEIWRRRIQAHFIPVVEVCA